MKLEPVTKLDKKNTATSKKLDDDVMSLIVTSSSFFRFMASLQQSGSRIPGAWSIRLTFSLIVTLCLAKPENKTKKSQTQLSNIALSKGPIFAKKC